jgi:hypothetical protein
VVRFRRTLEAGVAAVKRDLAQWLDEHRPDHTATRIALLETALDRYLAEETDTASDLARAAASVIGLPPSSPPLFAQ